MTKEFGHNQNRHHPTLFLKLSFFVSPLDTKQITRKEKQKVPQLGNEQQQQQQQQLRESSVSKRKITGTITPRGEGRGYT